MGTPRPQEQVLVRMCSALGSAQAALLTSSTSHDSGPPSVGGFQA